MSPEDAPVNSNINRDGTRPAEAKPIEPLGKHHNAVT